MGSEQADLPGRTKVEYPSIQRIRRSLVLGSLSYRPSALSQFADDFERLDDEVVEWELRNTAALAELHAIISGTLLRIWSGNAVLIAWHQMREDIAQKRRESPPFEGLIATTPPLMELMHSPYPGDDIVHARLKELWVAIGQHEKILEIYKSVFATNPMGAESMSSMLPHHFLPLLREWLVKNYKPLAEIGTFAREQMVALEQGGEDAVRQRITLQTMVLSDAVLTLMRRVPDLRRIFEPDEHVPIRTVIAVFIELPY